MAKIDEGADFSDIRGRLESYLKHYDKDIEKGGEKAYALSSFNIRARFSEMIIDMAVRETSHDTEESWEAAAWLNEWMGSEYRFTLEAGDETYRFTPDSSLYETHVLDAASAVSAFADSLSGSYIATYADKERTVAVNPSSVQLESPWDSTLYVDIAVPVRFSMNGFDGSSETFTRQFTLGSDMELPVPESDDPTQVFIGWCAGEKKTHDLREVLIPAEDHPEMDMEQSEVIYYAQYISLETDYMIGDVMGNNNSVINSGETIVFYPIIGINGNLDIRDFSLTVRPVEKEGITLRKVGNPDSYNVRNIDSGRVFIVAGEDSSIGYDMDDVNRTYFTRNYPDNRYEISVLSDDGNGSFTLSVPVSFTVAGKRFSTTLSFLLEYREHVFKASVVGWKLDDIDGNNDGIANPGENVGLDVTWKLDSGSENAYGVESRMTTDREGVMVTTGIAEYDEIEEGRYVNLSGSYSSSSSAASNLRPTSTGRYRIRISSTAPAGSVPLKFTLTDDMGGVATDTINIPVSYVNGQVVLSKWDFYEVSGDGDGTVNPGESINLGYLFRNTGSSTLNDLRIVFSTETEGVTLSNRIVSRDSLRKGYGTNSSGQTYSGVSDTGASSKNGVRIDVSKDYKPGTPITVTWKATCAGSSSEGWSGKIEIPVVAVRSNPVISKYDFYDVEGNADGICSPGEFVTVDVITRNSGEARIRNLRWTYSSDSEYLTVTSPGPYTSSNELRSGYFMRLSTGNTYSSMPSFSSNAKVRFAISKDAPAGSRAEIKVTFTDGINTWTRSIWMTIDYPDSVLSVERRVLIDSLNGDGQAGIGETAYLDYIIHNEGESDVNVTATLTSGSEGIIITKGNHDYGLVKAGYYKSIKNGTNGTGSSRNNVSVSSSMTSKSDNCLSFRVTSDAPLDSRATVTLTLSNGYEEWSFPMSFIVRKPDLGVDVTVSLRDKQSYELVYPGETLGFNFNVKNEMTSAISDLTLNITSDSSIISVPSVRHNMAESISRGGNRSISIRENTPVVSSQAKTGDRFQLTFTFRDSNGLEKSFVKSYEIGPDSFNPVITNVKTYGLSTDGKNRIVPGGYVYVDALLTNIGSKGADVIVRLSSDDPAVTVTGTPALSVGSLNSGYSTLLSHVDRRFSYGNRNGAVSGMLEGEGVELKIADDATPGAHEVKMTVYADGTPVLTVPVNLTVR